MEISAADAARAAAGEADAARLASEASPPPAQPTAATAPPSPPTPPHAAPAALASAALATPPATQPAASPSPSSPPLLPPLPPAAAAASLASPRAIVLVTGGSGLVGRGIRAVVEEAIAAGASAPSPLWPSSTDFVFVGSRDADLRDAAATRALFARVRPTHVVHAAATVGGLFKNLRAPVELGRDNVLMADSVMEASRAHGCKLITFLSTCIFPDKVAYPITEAALHEGPPHPSNAAYAHAKRFADVMARAYRAEYGCRFSSVVPTNVYGPHDNFNLSDAHVIPALVHKALLAKRSGAAFVVAGSGAPLRQFVHSRDLARLTLLALFAYDEAEPIILSVGAEAEVSIRRVAELVAEATGLAPGQLAFDASLADGQFRKTASNARLLRLLAEKGVAFAFTPIEAGIRETVTWLEKNFETARK